MFKLALSILIPWLVPLAYLGLSRTKLMEQTERVTIALVFIALLIGFIPQHFEEEGWISLLFLALSAALFMVGENAARRLGRRNQPLSLLIFASLLFVHGLADGTGLSITQLDLAHSHEHSHHAGEVLAYSIVLHRLPACIGIWAFLRPRFGMKAPLLLYFIMSVATLLGYFASTYSFAEHLTGPQVHVLEYFIAGGLIHFGIHAANRTEPSKASV